MIGEGDIVLFRFPLADLSRGKLRPALLLRKIPNDYGDWLICMVSTRLHQQIEGMEIVVKTSDADFQMSGLKTDSLIRCSRLAVVSESVFEGKVGSLSQNRLANVRGRLSDWLRAE